MAAMGLAVGVVALMWCKRIYADMPGVGVVLGIVIFLLGLMFVGGLVCEAVRCVCFSRAEAKREEVDMVTYRAEPEPLVKWPHVCVDIETMATVPGAVILEIGLVAFGPVMMKRGEMGTGTEFSVEVALRAVDQQEREMDDDTLFWWVDRMKDGATMPGQHGGQTLRYALEWMCEWARKYVEEDAQWWAWGTDFDISILNDALRQFDMPAPWKYAKVRCARTLCAVAGVKRKGEVQHIALEDARQEAVAVMEALTLVEKTRRGEEERKRTLNAERETSNVEVKKEEEGGGL